MRTYALDEDLHVGKRLVSRSLGWVTRRRRLVLPELRRFAERCLGATGQHENEHSHRERTRFPHHDLRSLSEVCERRSSEPVCSTPAKNARNISRALPITPAHG